MFAQNARLFGIVPSEADIEDTKIAATARSSSVTQLLAERRKQLAQAHQSIQSSSESSLVANTKQVQIPVAQGKKKIRSKSHLEANEHLKPTSVCVDLSDSSTFIKGKRWNAEVVLFHLLKSF
jgi:hypothetical protein